MLQHTGIRQEAAVLMKPMLFLSTPMDLCKCISYIQSSDLRKVEPVNNFAFEASSKCRGLKTPLNNQHLCGEESQVISEWSCEWRLSPVRLCNQQAPFWEKRRKEKLVSWKCHGTGTLDSLSLLFPQKEGGGAIWGVPERSQRGRLLMEC